MNKLSKMSSFLSQLEATRRHYGANRASMYARAIRLLRADFSPKEIFLWGLLDPAIDEDSLKRFVSKERFSRFQASQSPVSHAVLLEDKEVFYRYCEAIDFPIPETLAFLSGSAVWFARGSRSGPEVTLRDLLHELDGCELILKPCDGVYGIGVRAFIVEAGQLVEDGKRISLHDLIRELSPGTRYVLQRRLSNHPSLGELTGLRTLQALRVVTALPDAPGARAKVMSASLRLSANESVVNNFDYGRGGNIRGKIDLESGKVIRAVRAAPSGFGLKEIDTVQRTGRRLIGHEMPAWKEMKELLEVKAACFYPIRLVGWDVALTPDGPVVIEGNFWFDPAENAFGDVRAFIDAVTSGLCFTPRDGTARAAGGERAQSLPVDVHRVDLRDDSTGFGREPVN